VAANNIAKWMPQYAPPTPTGPVIKANDQVDNVTISSSDDLSVTIQLDPGEYAGTEVDWWVIIGAGSSWMYMNNSFQWVAEDNMLKWHPVYQGPLFNLPVTEVLNMTGLAAGSYTFYFVVDYPMDGVLHLDGPILVDAVNVTVQ